ncbi:MAG: hypothetical protein LQ350_006272 [Teloschistes chrysophthalmus]|nr:MAG: hypothetical protein LQ350_006272 [Niorma chrysophthalma]
MASSSAMEGQHPSATHPSHSENDPSLGPAKTPSTSASTKRSHSKPSFQFHTGISAVGANKDNRHPATTARLADHLHQHASRGHHGPTPNPTHAPLDRGSSGGGARGSVTPGGGDGSEASSQACESAEVSESERGVIRRERTDVVHLGPGGGLLARGGTGWGVEDRGHKGGKKEREDRGGGGGRWWWWKGQVEEGMKGRVEGAGGGGGGWEDVEGAGARRRRWKGRVEDEKGRRG